MPEIVDHAPILQPGSLNRRLDGLAQASSGDGVALTGDTAAAAFGADVGEHEFGVLTESRGPPKDHPHPPGQRQDPSVPSEFRFLVVGQDTRVVVDAIVSNKKRTSTEPRGKGKIENWTVVGSEGGNKSLFFGFGKRSYTRRGTT